MRALKKVFKKKHKQTEQPAQLQGEQTDRQRDEQPDPQGSQQGQPQGSGGLSVKVGITLPIPSSSELLLTMLCIGTRWSFPSGT
jgi:hypothetical protein